MENGVSKVEGSGKKSGFFSPDDSCGHSYFKSDTAEFSEHDKNSVKSDLGLGLRLMRN